jgi:hypothetical protein
MASLSFDPPEKPAHGIRDARAEGKGFAPASLSI